MTVAPARRVALAALGRIRRDRSYSGAVVNAVLAREGLGRPDAALVTRLVYGVVSTEGVLDETIGRHARGKIEPRVRDVLRLSAYELLFGRAPGYAVVDQGVAAVRAIRPHAAGLTNAVLRRIADEAVAFPWGDPASDRDALARATAHPRWIVDEVLASLGEKRGRESLASALEPAPHYVRLDPFAGPTTDTDLRLASALPAPCPVDEDCRVLGEPAAVHGVPGDHPWFAMDAASQFAPRALAPGAGERVLDIGAGRGNKTVCLQAIAMRAGGPAAITALDVHAGKASVLRERLRRSGVPSVEVIAGDAEHLAGAVGESLFDAVLLDAPCTGLGTLRRYPEKRWRLEPSDIVRLASLQSTLLASAAGAVRPGGRLVYATCSLAAAENAQVVERFCGGDAGAGFTVVDLSATIPAEWNAYATSEGYFQSWPTADGPDGHFVALLRRHDV